MELTGGWWVSRKIKTLTHCHKPLSSRLCDTPQNTTTQKSQTHAFRRPNVTDTFVVFFDVTFGLCLVCLFLCFGGEHKIELQPLKYVFDLNT